MKVLLAFGLICSTACLLAQEPVAVPVAPSVDKATEQAEETAGAKPRFDLPQICVDVLMVSLPEEKALQLLPLLNNPETVEKAQQTVLEMVGSKGATLTAWPHLTTPNGQRAVTEAITEERYPVEFEPLKDAKNTKDPNAKAESFKDGAYVIPTVFETRNTGVTLSAQPVASPDGRLVTLQINPEIVRLVKMKDYAAGLNPKGEKETVQQPIFQTRSLNTNLTLRNGQRIMVYFGKPIDAGGAVDIFIAGAKVIPAIK